jgi:hypothetical protein
MQASKDNNPHASRTSCGLLFSQLRNFVCLRKNRLCVMLLLIIHCMMLVNISNRTSPNKDEAGHIAGGLMIWQYGRYDLYCVNPPLVRLIASYPITVAGLEEDWCALRYDPINRPEFSRGLQLMQKHPERHRFFLRLGRWACLPISLLGGYLCYKWVLHAVNQYAAFTALSLWAFSPAMLAHAGSISPDALAASTGILAAYTFRNWLRRPRWGAVIPASVSLGLAELAKLTWVILFPLWILIGLIWLGSQSIQRKTRLNQFVQGGSILLLALFVINAGYCFKASGSAINDHEFHSILLSSLSTKHGDEQGDVFQGAEILANVPIPLPKDYISGIDIQRCDFEGGVPSFIRGERADHGWWYYYLYALLVKMPLGTWGLFFLAIVCTLFLKGYNAPWRDEMIVILPGLTLFLFVSSQTGFSLHSRYILPALPFLFIWISKVGRAFTAEVKTRNPRSTKYVRALVCVFLTWMIASSLWIYPHSLSYFNELAAVLPTPYDEEYPTPMPSSEAEERTRWQKIEYVLDAGPCNGPRHLLDSNIDWGQDLFYLEDWYESHPEARPMRLAYWGSYPLELSKIENAESPPYEPEPGWYALSVNEIYSRSKQYRYFLNYEPVDSAGYSIYIYHITLDDANRVRKEMGWDLLDETFNEVQTATQIDESDAR